MAISPERPDRTDGGASDGEATDGGATDGGATGDESATGTATPAATEPAASVDGAGPVAVLRRILADHVVHVGVIVLFAIYPLLYTQLMATPFAAELDVIFPRTRTMILVLYVGLFAMSFDFVSGYTGYLSFGHAMFYGIGAYLVVLAANGKVPFLDGSTPLLLILLVGGVLAAVAALIVGAVSFRLTGVYFAMITLGFAEVAHVFVRNWDYVGSNPRDGAGFVEAYSIGIPGVYSVDIGQIVGTSYDDVLGTAFDLSRADVSFYAIGVVVLLSYFAMQRIIHSPFGRVMVAIRENEERARAVGYDTFRYKMGAFAISGFFAAVAGGLFAGYRRSVAPENTFDLFVTADALLATIIGGFGTLAGALYGFLFQEVLQGILSTESHGLARYLRDTLPESVLEAGVGDATVLEAINLLIDGRAPLYVGIVFILFVLYVPEGILGTLRSRFGGPVARRLPERIRRYRGGN